MKGSQLHTYISNFSYGLIGERKAPHRKINLMYIYIILSLTNAALTNEALGALILQLTLQESQ